MADVKHARNVTTNPSANSRRLEDSVEDIYQQRLADEANASRVGNLYRAFLTVTVTAGTTAYFALDIPADLEVFGFTRFTEVSGDTVTSQFLTCTGFSNGAGSMAGLNFDRRSSQTSKTGQVTLREVTSPTGTIAHSPDSEIFVSTTPVRSASVQTEAGAQPAFDDTELPLFGYTNEAGNNDADVTIYLFWQELTPGVS